MAATPFVKEGEFTSSIYGMIKEQKFKDAVGVLEYQRQQQPSNRAALSLLGYCYYQIQDFYSAASCYEELVQLYPDIDDYKLYHAQALYKAGENDQAVKVSAQIENGNYKTKLLKLQAAAKYVQEDVKAARMLVEQCPANDADTENNQGCLLSKEGKFLEAAQKFHQAKQVLGFKPQIAYNIALCHYQLKQYPQALKHIADIIEHGIRHHPELSVGMTTEGIEVRSVGNTVTLHESALIEAFNLKAAIEFSMRNAEAACEALTDMPPRSLEELDPVTLHNQALMQMEQNPSAGFEKLQFLLQQPSFPRETFGNILLLYIRYEYFDLAADVLAENAHLVNTHLSRFLYDFIETVILRVSAPEEAFRRLDEICAQQTDILRKLTKQVQEARIAHDDEGVKRAVSSYDDALEKYIAALMQQAKIYWDRENYAQVERIFRKSVEFCNDHEVWKLNVGHVLFMQENKYKEAIGFYEPIVKKHLDSVCSVAANVLANLCVSYIMTSQNEEAEELMRKIEKEEERQAYEDPNKKLFHLCIVNLVIGTLYCAKGNYEFGISRVIKSLEPYQKKLGTETWFYAKRCFLSLIENMSKHMIMPKDAVLYESVQFLEHCETYGRDVKANVVQPLIEGHTASKHPGKNTITFEARLLKALLLDLMYY